MGEGVMEVETGAAGAMLKGSVVSGSIFTGWEAVGGSLPVAVDGARVVARLQNGSFFSVPPAHMKQNCSQAAETTSYWMLP